MKIYAKVDKKRVLHGELKDGVFRRVILSYFVRWSDRSFCINTGVLPTLEENGCHTFQFDYCAKSTKYIYEMSYEQAMTYKKKVNEYGEENIRIPIDDCRLIKKIDYEPTEKPKIESKPQKPIQEKLF